MPVKTKHYLLLFLISIFLPSCRRIINWGKGTFNQGCNLEEPLKEYRDQVRSVHVYDQLSTLGIFDAIVLTPDLVDYYNKIENKKLNFSGTAFFVLAFADRTDYKPLNADSTNEWRWSVSMMHNDKKFERKYQKCIKLPAEFQFLFGKKWSRFKSAYLVEFDKVKLDGNITLCFTSIRKKAALLWSFKDGVLVEDGKPCCFKKGCEGC